MKRGGLIALGLAAGATGAAALIATAESQEPVAPPAPARSALAAPAAPALAIPPPRGLADGPELTRWAHVRRTVVAPRAPAPCGTARGTCRAR